ncbi:MAG: sigma-70 family RNA polymerase sigma factor [Bacteroidales bacterium]|nr:sigma-70 family RNA polymerase sigma factor [Bacteroidales bacterium]
MVINEKEFEHLIKEHKRRIYTVCYMFSKDEDEISDLFQEILINIWRGIQNFQGEKYISTWIWKVSFNTCINASRKAKKENKRLPLDVDINLYEDMDTESMQIRQLHDKIGQLGYIDRSLVLLWLENLSYDEIGAILGITANNVAVKLLRIKEKMRNSINK